IAEVERRASLLALPRCSNVIEDNGKEKDPETGFLYYGARYHWPEVWTGWLSPDPMMDEYPGISPYAYCMWNPIVTIDPNGCDTLVFNKFGNYLHTIKSDGEHVGIYDPPSGKPYNFTFADPINDPISIEEGKITKLQIVQEIDIRTMLFNAGVFSDDNRDRRLGYIKEEGVGLGKLDFSKKAKGGMISMYGSDVYHSMYLVDGVAHNPDNFGNFLFGAAGNALGIPLVALKLGAHWNSIVNSKENGYKRQLDSKDDQFSIKCGFNHAKRHKYNTINDNRSK
ncbi:MAG: RHS repeat-associated core domain-containing protein, partial [bacterium P3]